MAEDIDQAKQEVESFARTYTNGVRYEVHSEIVAAKDEIKSERDNMIVAAKDEVKGYANSENQKLKIKIDTAKDEVKSFAQDYTNSVRDKVKSYTDIKIAAAKAKIKSDTDNAIVAAKNEVRIYAKNEDKKVESKIHETLFGHSLSSHGLITLEGSNAGPDRGYVYYKGRPLCGEDSAGYEVWDIQAAHVICKMLGFARAAKFSEDRCDYGSCPPSGIPFSMSGFKCTGSETHITDCPHDPTVSSWCGTNGVTGGVTYSSADIIGVECEKL